MKIPQLMTAGGAAVAALALEPVRERLPAGQAGQAALAVALLFAAMKTSGHVKAALYGAGTAIAIDTALEVAGVA